MSVNGVGRSTGGVDRAISQKWSEKSKCGVCGARARREAHATVKPLDLMRWLVRLVTPVGAVVLEPFAGSGTTAEACVLEDRRCVAIEREAEYLPLIVSRLRKPVQQGLFGLETGA
uniref:DNA methyltransferase n=1 Tax=Mycobacteroides chelonae TaxID=1774 RepID=UPI003985F10F